MDKQALVNTLKTQHRGLQTDLLSIKDIKEPNTIVSGLEKFKKDLLEHLGLENGTFYQELLKNMEAKGQDTTDTKKFIASMDDIATAVMAFLDKYKEATAVEQNIVAFPEEIMGIIKTLNLRVESEEDGVYEVFLIT